MTFHLKESNSGHFIAAAIIVAIIGRMLLLSSYKQNPQESLGSIIATQEGSKIIEMKSWLEGRKIISLVRILDDSIHINIDELAILISSTQDCASCIEDGHQVLRELREENAVDKIYKIELVSDIEIKAHISPDGFYTFVDHKHGLQEELRYFYTPVLLRLNGKMEVIDAYYPRRGHYEEAAQEFIFNAIYN